MNPSITLHETLTFADKTAWAYMSINTPTIRLMGDLLSLISTFQAIATVFCMGLPVAMVENEFDAGWPKAKTYVEAGICSQCVFDIINPNPFRKTISSKSCSTTTRYAVRGAPLHQISTVSDCPDILENCDWDLPGAWRF
jgi:hypothetical protein